MEKMTEGQIDGLLSFKGSIFNEFTSKRIGGATYKLGINGHGEYVILKDGKPFDSKISAYHILEEWNKL